MTRHMTSMLSLVLTFFRDGSSWNVRSLPQSVICLTCHYSRYLLSLSYIVSIKPPPSTTIYHTSFFQGDTLTVNLTLDCPHSLTVLLQTRNVRPSCSFRFKDSVLNRPHKFRLVHSVSSSSLNSFPLLPFCTQVSPSSSAVYPVPDHPVIPRPERPVTLWRLEVKFTLTLSALLKLLYNNNLKTKLS